MADIRHPTTTGEVPRDFTFSHFYNTYAYHIHFNHTSNYSYLSYASFTRQFTYYALFIYLTNGVILPQIHIFHTITQITHITDGHIRFKLSQNIQQSYTYSTLKYKTHTYIYNTYIVILQFQTNYKLLTNLHKYIHTHYQITMQIIHYTYTYYIHTQTTTLKTLHYTI
jgi:hypothetical protein